MFLQANLVSLWTTNKSRGIESNGNDINGEPEVLCSAIHNGSVTDMQVCHIHLKIFSLDSSTYCSVPMRFYDTVEVSLSKLPPV